LDKIPFETRRVIEDLTELWQTRNEPHDILTHLTDACDSGSIKVYLFFKKVYEDLRTDKRSKYIVLSASDFKQFLETEYLRLANQPKEVVRIEFGGKRRAISNISLKTDRISYENHCWNCEDLIYSGINDQCLVCDYYICSSCGSCLCGFKSF
jgi:hypothetical protein